MMNIKVMTIMMVIMMIAMVIVDHITCTSRVQRH